MQDEPERCGKPEAAAFIAGNLRLEAVPGVPEIRLHTAHAGSGLWRLTGREGPPPYWAYRWAGGTVLARHLLDHPEAARGRRVLDLGAGAGIVGIAAAFGGAATVTAAETDPNGLAALALNAVANGVAITPIGDDLLDGPPPPDIDLIAVGDLFYEPELATRVTAFLDRCRLAGIDILVGDPGRTPLPRHRLKLLAEYAVPDFGGGEMAASGVYKFVADAMI